jgi:glycosyltransferase involved in cell wall biosynthesis/SAM-dependent methyltransferase
VAPSLGEVSAIDGVPLAGVSERQRIVLKAPATRVVPCVECEMAAPAIESVVIALLQGWPGRIHMDLARRALHLGRRTYFHWPEESAIEAVDEERLASYWRHWLVIQAHRRIIAPATAMIRRLRGLSGDASDLWMMARMIVQACSGEVQALVDASRPVRLALPAPSGGPRVPGTGVYLRTDFWAKLSSGGSYGHTCHVARQLARACDRFVCFMPHRYELLDHMKVHQVVLPAPCATSSEEEILAASSHYYRLLKLPLEALRPAFLYERICLGNYVGARLSQELSIPYLVEYNGSELSMKKSFDGEPYRYEELYLKAEDAAFRQATLISVVSESVRDDLLRRGVAAEKILVNPNGADPEIYAPPAPGSRAALRRELGFEATDCVVGFSGTFGGWHGVDVLAAAIPRICAHAGDVRFLLIGDGNFKHQIDEQVAAHGLEARVRSVGRVPQSEGARLLGACDVFVSPHNAHMVDARFFGSPTKVFEYMAMGGAIVASDLEQIGQVLSPAIRVADLTSGDLRVDGQRSVLVSPGDVEELVTSVVALASRRDLWPALGRNARQAVLDHYSWERHVNRLWDAVRTTGTDGAGTRAAGAGAGGRTPGGESATVDAYKAEVQRQWDNDPCGSHYVQARQPRSLDWFLEAERYRYGEYAPWMPATMEFARHADRRVLEIGGGMGTDGCQFAQHGAHMTDLDLSAGHLALARQNFRLRGLAARFVHGDGERLPFADGAFDVVYSNGAIHHTPDTGRVIAEIHRVLRPGGRVIVMVYAENSLHYWRNLVWDLGLKQGLLRVMSMGEIMSRHVELSQARSRPLVKVYTPGRLRRMFGRFSGIEIVQRQLTPAELPAGLRRLPVDVVGKLVGWNLVLKATKPRTG